MSTDALQRVIERIVVEHPEVWEVFRVDPEAAIEAAGIELTPEEREAIRQASQKLARGLKPSASDQRRRVAEALLADLEQARREQEAARKRLLQELEAEKEPEPSEGTPDLLAEERRRLRAEAEKMRAALAEERRRVEEERRRAERLLGRRRRRPDKEESR